MDCLEYYVSIELQQLSGVSVAVQLDGPPSHGSDSGIQPALEEDSSDCFFDAESFSDVSNPEPGRQSAHRLAHVHRHVKEGDEKHQVRTRRARSGIGGTLLA